jgi:hypothetical protein
MNIIDMGVKKKKTRKIGLLIQQVYLFDKCIDKALLVKG